MLVLPRPYPKSFAVTCLVEQQVRPRTGRATLVSVSILVQASLLEARSSSLPASGEFRAPMFLPRVSLAHTVSSALGLDIDMVSQVVPFGQAVSLPRR